MLLDNVQNEKCFETWVHGFIGFISYGIPKECHIHVYENWLIGEILEFQSVLMGLKKKTLGQKRLTAVEVEAIVFMAGAFWRRLYV